MMEEKMKRFLCLLAGLMLIFGAANTASAAFTGTDFAIFAIGENLETSRSFGDMPLASGETAADILYSGFSPDTYANINVYGTSGLYADYETLTATYYMAVSEVPTVFGQFVNQDTNLQTTTLLHTGNGYYDNADDNAYNPSANIIGWLKNGSASANLANIQTEDVYMDILKFNFALNLDTFQWMVTSVDDTGLDMHVYLDDVNSNIIRSEIASAAVPVPAAVWLLGSGLLGLVGISRRNARV